MQEDEWPGLPGSRHWRSSAGPLEEAFEGGPGAPASQAYRWRQARGRAWRAKVCRVVVDRLSDGLLLEAARGIKGAACAHPLLVQRG